MSRSSGGGLARRLLPAAVVVPILLGWLRLASERSGLLSSELGQAIAVGVNILLFAILIWVTALAMNRADRRRTAARHASTISVRPP